MGQSQFLKGSVSGPVCICVLYTKTTMWSEQPAEVLQKCLWQSAGCQGQQSIVVSVSPGHSVPVAREVMVGKQAGQAVLK